MSVNQHIPKYILQKPSYLRTGEKDDLEDYLSHHRRNKDEIVDYSVAQSGLGIKESEQRGEENYDAKRDRWHGYNLDQWQQMLDNWDENKVKKVEDDDDDDTDYELELFELNLTAKDIKRNIKENRLEKTVRDRQDIALYIHNITSNPDNKIKIDYDPKSRQGKTQGLINDEDEFVRKSSDDKFSKLQKFAWEINQQEDEDNKQKSLHASLNNEKADIEVNLQNNLEASPTLMMLKQKQHQQKLKQESDVKKQKLLAMYGGGKYLKGNE